jgi:hypothetical protein
MHINISRLAYSVAGGKFPTGKIGKKKLKFLEIFQQIWYFSTF